MNELISIARSGDALGTWSAADVGRMLESGVLTSSDHFWQEGMTDWNTLDRFAPPPPVVTSRVRFGTAFAVDQLGFVGTGEVKLTATGIEYVGRRLWPGWMRALIFLVATGMGWFVFGAITAIVDRSIPPDAGAVVYLLATVLNLFTVVGTPLLVLTVMPHFCASLANLTLDRIAISMVNHRGRGVSFLAARPTGKPRRASLRAASAADAATIAAHLRSDVAPSHLWHS